MNFADDVGTPLFKSLETPGALAHLLLFVMVVFAILIVVLSLVVIFLRRRLKFDKDEDVINLP